MSEPLDLQGLIDEAAAIDAVAGYVDGPDVFSPWVTPDGRSPQRDYVLGARDYPRRLFQAGNRCGKTFTGGFDVAAAARGTHPCFPFSPPLSIWVSALDRDFGVAQVAWPAIKRWIPPQEIASAAWHRREPESPLTIRLRNGSQIDFKTVDSGRQKYQGTGLHLVWTDEEHPADIMQEIRARLLDYGGRLNVTCTPLLRSAWLQDLTRDPKTLVVRASMLDAAHAGVINLQEVLDYADSLPERQRRVRVLGDFVAMEGAVYPSFSAATHVAKPRDGALWIGDKRVCDYPIPAKWPRYAAADFGINHPMAVGRAAHDGRIGRLIVERCWYASGVRFSRWAETLGPELGKLAGPLICDRDAGGRAEFDAAGIETAPALKAIQAGIELVERLLEPRSDGLPGIVLVEDPTLIHPTLGRCDARRISVEIGNYHYPENKEGKPLRADLPVKQDDDAVDMLRYLATTVSMWTRTGAPGKVDDGIGRRLKVDW